MIKQAQWAKPIYAAQYKNSQIHIDAIVYEGIEPILVNDFAPGKTRYVVPSISMYSANIYLTNVFAFKEKVYSYIDNLRSGCTLITKMVPYTYSTRNSLVSIHFIWKIPEEISLLIWALNNKM